MQLKKKQTKNPSKLNVEVPVIHGKTYWFRLLFEYSFQGHYEKRDL